MHNSFKSLYNDELLLCIRQAISEDLGQQGDHTSQAIFPQEHQSKAKLVAKDNGVLAGVLFCQMILEQHAPEVLLTPVYSDGDSFVKGDILLTLEGKTQHILSLERILLNSLQRMSGIATVTRSVQLSICDTSCTVLDTRKTTPNFRIAEKWAVHIGGGMNHRMGLYDAIMLKDNHIDFCGGLDAALKKTKAYVDNLASPIPVIVETRSIDDLRTCLGHPWIRRVLIDNMPPEQLIHAVALVNNVFPTEASGNITPDNIVAYAKTGVDFVSLGYITHSAPVLDMSLCAV
ncbi:MAG: carboxylating nicotinate-nucleotide diphosphorylase [Flavobacteriaceae bacterium]|nr:carboxylating nicotinate-nucleotide diphosphorylase [Flavobacteriaceae bacterium]